MKEKKEYRLKIFCDFDGTVAKNDVCITSLGPFINDSRSFEELCDRYSKGEISTREVNLRLLNMVENFSYERFDKYLGKEQIDEGFHDFLEYAKENGHEVIVASEGYDYYIDYVLNKEGIKIKSYSNRFFHYTAKDEKSGEEGLKVSCDFPHSDAECEWCGVSKRNILINHTNDLYDEISVFIGDGASDFCVSHYADIVFAKKKLASYCWKNNITYFEFDTFRDIQKKLIKLTEQNKIKHRQVAKTKRKDVLLGG